MSVYETGSINWSTGALCAVGKAAPKNQSPEAKEAVYLAARINAAQNILAFLKQLKITNELTVGDLASQNHIVMTGLEKTAREAAIVKQVYSSGLAAEITVETGIFGGFLQLVLPEEIRQIPKITTEANPKQAKMIEKSLYTGLIVDARGLGIEPVLNPVIVSEQGHPVYSSEFISREFAVQGGVCKYVCDFETAIRDNRTGDNPMVFKGLRKEGSKNATLVISMSDYQLLEKRVERHAFFNECRVIIVWD